MPSQFIDFPFAGGVDEKTQSQLVEPGAALSVTNLRQLKNGSYQKRLGNSLASNATFTGGTLTTGKRLLGYKDELIQTTGLGLLTRSPTANAWKVVDGLTPQVGITNQPAVALPAPVNCYASNYVNGYIVVAYCVSPSSGNYVVYATAFDATNGSVVVAATPLNTLFAGTIPRITVVVAGNIALVLYGDSVTGTPLINGSFLNTSSLGNLNAGFVDSGGSYADANANLVRAQIPFDACSLGGTHFAVVQSVTSGTTSKVSVSLYDSSVSITNPAATASLVSSSVLGADSPESVAIAGSYADKIFVAFPYDNGTVTKVAGLVPSTLNVVDTSTTAVTVAGARAQRLGLVWTSTGNGTLQAFSDTDAMYFRRFHSNGTTYPVTSSLTFPEALPLTAYNHTPDSKMFIVNSRTYCTMRPNLGFGGGATTDGYPDPNQVLLIDVTQTLTDQLSYVDPNGTPHNYGYLRVAGNPLPRISYGEHTRFTVVLSTATHILPSEVASISSTKVVVPIASIRSIGSGVASIELVTLDWGNTNQSQPGVLGEALALGGSPPSCYDGTSTSEIGFFQRPVLGSVSISSSGSIGAGDYKWVSLYEWVDSRGQVHQSNISDASAITTVGAGGKKATIPVQPLTSTNRSGFYYINNGVAIYAVPVNGVRHALFRTLADGNIFLRVPLAIDQTYNDPSVVSQSLVDDFVDSRLGAPLYTQPGLPNVAQVKVTPPPFSCQVVHGNRLFGACGRTVWFSFQSVYGEGYSFADAFQFDVEEGGSITALASLDGALVVFKRDRIAFVDGQGPPDNGAGGDFSQPQFIAADVGCIEPRSICVTPAGVMFQSLRGIEMLSRGRSLATYFGSRVEATLAANPVITSAVLDEAKGTVTFTCLPTETSSTGVEIIWDYVHNLWVHDTRSSLAASGIGIKSAIMWGNQPGTVPVRTCLSAAGAVYQEATADYRDSGTVFVPYDLTSPWIKMGGLQGYGRTSGFGILFEQKTPCDLLVSIRVDYRSTVVQTRLFTAQEIADEIAAGRNPIELWVTMKVQKCTAFQVELSDATPTGGPAVGTGQGAVLIGLRIEYQQKKDRNRGIVTG